MSERVDPRALSVDALALLDAVANCERFIVSPLAHGVSELHGVSGVSELLEHGLVRMHRDKLVAIELSSEYLDAVQVLLSLHGRSPWPRPNGRT